MDALPFLEKADRAKLAPLYVVHGDEVFLRRQVVQAIRRRALGPDASDGLSVYGADASFAAVFDELQTMPFFGERRLIVVEDADKFVTEHRGAIEKALGRLPENNVLVLDVKSWPATTRLAKLIDASATIACKAPANYRLPQWCSAWAEARYAKKLPAQAAALLVELAGGEMGMLDQEINKLSIYVGDRAEIRTGDVDKLVGQNRAAQAFKIFDAIGAGRTDEALTILERLFEQGEEPIKLLGAFSYQLRRLAQAARLAEQGVSLQTALERVGVPPFGIQSAQQQLRRIGRERARQLFDWLIETDLGLKGSSPLPPRIQFERLVVKLAVGN